MQDRYGNSVSTRSDRALELYQEGVDLFLAAQPGGIEALEVATREDDGFAVAYADLARALQIMARQEEASACAKRAVETVRGASDRETEHVEIMDALVNGRSGEGFKRIQEHIRTYPRDVMTVMPCCGVFGLIGFSGKVGREAENLAFMAAVADHYKDDWWFDSLYAFALCEVGQLDRAEALNEKAFEANPTNANAVHHRAHIHYEQGKGASGRTALNDWRAGYSRDGLLHCHLAWHDALWALEMGDVDRVWEIVASDVHPDKTVAPPINVMTDLVAVLLRAELAGQARRPELWEIVRDYALDHFARPGLSFADAHSAIAFALTQTQEQMPLFLEKPKGLAGDLVAAIARAYQHFFAENWQAAVDHLIPVMPYHERLGGSRAQRDLLELTVAYALARQGNEKHARQFLHMRRPQIVRQVLAE